MALLRDRTDHPSWHRVRIRAPYVGALPDYPDNCAGVLSSLWVDRDSDGILVTVTSNGNTLVDAAMLTTYLHRHGRGLLLPKGRLISPGALVSVTAEGCPAETEVEMLIIKARDIA